MHSQRVIALVDPVGRGHSPAYFSICWKVLSQLPSVKLAGICPEPEKTRGFLTTHGIGHADIHRLNAAPTTFAGEGERARARQKISLWKNLAAATQQVEAGTGLPIDLTVIIWLEPFLGRHVSGRAVDRAFPRPWSGLYLHPYHFRIGASRRHWLRNKLFPEHAALLARNCRAALTLDEGVVAPMRRALAKPVLCLPDTTDLSPASPDFELARQIKTRAGGRTVCGLLGVLQKRKGILPLLQAAAARPDGWFFVFAGEIQTGDYSPAEMALINRFLQSPPDNCLFWPKLIPDEAGFNAVVAACDVIYAAYEFFPHSSNLMTKAALFGKPVVVSPGYLMAERTEKFRLGWVLPEYSDAAVIKLFSGTGRPQVQQICAQASFKEFLAEHSHERLATVFAELLEV